LDNCLRGVSIAIAAISLVLLAGCSSSSGDGAAKSDSSNNETLPLLELPAQASVSQIDMNTQLTTEYSDAKIDGWACLSDSGFAYIYMFYPEGVITGFNNNKVGMEIFFDPDNMPTSLESQNRYFWTQLTNDSLLMDSPQLGTTVSFNNIRFTDDEQMSAFSSERGQLFCKRESYDR